jgi:YggT family protein
MKNALSFLIDTFAQLYLLLLLMRFWLPVLRANFRNPIAQGVLRFTSPAVVPVRRFVPAIGPIDSATVLVGLVIQVLVIFVLMLIDRGGSAVAIVTGSFLNVVFDAFLRLASMSVTLFIVAILIRVILSFFQRYFGPITEMLNEMTEPLMRPIRRVIPPLGVIDLSAYITMILLIALNMVIADLRPVY